MRIRKFEQQMSYLCWSGCMIHDFTTEFGTKELKDCIILCANEEDKNVANCRSLHLAISEDIDDYIGTVSLKAIDRTNIMAEFEIAVRTTGMVEGDGIYAINLI